MRSENHLAIKCNAMILSYLASPCERHRDRGQTVATLSELKPTQKHLVMNLLSEAGFDVSDWARYKGKTPAANPKYCYNWSFEQPGEAFAVCLWHDGLKKKGDEIYHSFNPISRGAR